MSESVFVFSACLANKRKRKHIHVTFEKTEPRCEDEHGVDVSRCF